MSGTMTLHGHSVSTCTRRILVSLKEMGADVPLENVADFSEVKTPQWLEKQPFGQMPYLEDGDFVVFESRAIAKYLALKFDSPLLPKQSDAQAYALFEQACSIEMADFEPNVGGLLWELQFKQMHNAGDADAAKVEGFKTTLAKKLEGYERILSKHKYLAGDRLTLADLYHLTHGTLAVKLGVAPGLIDGSLPNVTRWWSSITSLESWKSLN